MADKSTNGLFWLGMGLIIGAGAIYGIFMLLGVSVAIGQATSEVGAPLFAVLALPAMAVLGFILLLAKVVIDRVGNAEDDHYSKTVDQ